MTSTKMPYYSLIVNPCLTLPTSDNNQDRKGASLQIPGSA